MTKAELMELISDNEQDQAECDAWMLDASDETLCNVIDLISKLCDDNKPPLMQVVGRFAQIGFAQALERRHREVVS